MSARRRFAAGRRSAPLAPSWASPGPIGAPEEHTMNRKPCEHRRIREMYRYRGQALRQAARLNEAVGREKFGITPLSDGRIGWEIVALKPAKKEDAR